MDDHEIKQMRKVLFHQLKIAEEKLECASVIAEREENVDAIPILFKTVDITARTLLSFKHKTPGDYLQNIKSLEEEFLEEKLFDKNSAEYFHHLYDMNEKYRSEMEFDYDETMVKDIFDKTEKFLNKTYKFLKNQLTTSRDRIIKKRVKKISIAAGILAVSALAVFLGIRLAFSIFGPKHGLLAYYYNNIRLKEPAAATRIDKKIDFVWGDLSPHRNIIDDFSARWEGKIKIEKNDKYTFYIRSDEGVKLFIDGKILINTWPEKKRVNEHSGSIKLKKGFHNIKLEYYFNQKFADLKLLWSSSKFKKKIVAPKYLFPPA